MAGVILREYQTAAVDAVEAAWRRGRRAPLLAAPTGSGKTIIAVSLIHRALDRGQRVLFLAPRRELIDQAYEKLDAAGLAVNVLMAGDPRRNDFARVTVASVDTLHARRTHDGGYRTLIPDLIVVDECHLFVTPLRAGLIGHWPDARIVGLTATPARKDGRALALLFDDLIEVATVAELTKAGFLVPARYFSLSEPDLSRVRVTAGDYNAQDLDREMNQSQLVADVVKTWMERAGGRRTVVFGTSIAHSAALCADFQAHGVAAEHLDANTPTDERRGVFARFRSGETQILTNCTLASYGFDLPELDCVDDQTEILTPNGWVSIDAPDPDEVVSFDMETGRLRVSPVQAIVRRTADEIIESRSPHVNFAVTPNHRMVIETGRPGSGWRVEVAASLRCRGRFRLPMSALCVGGRPDALWSDDQLRFAAWFATDGGWGPVRASGVRTAVVISQSKPVMVTHIRELLTRLGMVFSESIEGNNRGFGGATALPLHRFNIGQGVKPRNLDRGWLRLEPILSKGGGWILHLSPRQFALVWDEMLLADGDGNRTRSASREQLIVSNEDRCRNIQAAAAMCGWSSSAKAHPTQSGHPLFWVWAKPGPRSTEIKVNHPLKKTPSVVAVSGIRRVWCVQDRDGTIVTRRGGRVMIMGQCVVFARPTKSLVLYLQMLGRGLRPAPGKEYCLVLDHSGVVHRFGYADEDRGWSLEGKINDLREGARREKQELPEPAQIRDCPQCQCCFSGRQCPACGWFRPAKGVKIETLSGELVELNGIAEPDRDKLKFYLQLLGEFEIRGKKAGAAWYSYQDKYGEHPPRSWAQYPSMQPGDEVKRWVRARMSNYAKGQRSAA